ncbi:acyltransferase family protein [Pseudodonghicola flavimaris]|uniref:Acyltransferase n=1 Tax=Pseudodonghicola flavimaris TaxID=3050036 RepID=A0ABT7EY54_9RHOB|nr:acyltransferase [Pseudodonghicola flavimaris]MDK3017287.1 acyltransferase [Pseudodonghicola flavimaris]
MTGQKGATGRVEQLTGLRFFAALLVFAVHFRWDTSPEALRTLAQQGYVGVSFFFMLSGFVLTHSYGRRIRAGQVSFPSYVLLRIARLTPLHVLTGLPFVYFAIVQNEAIYSEAFGVMKTLLNLSFLQSWVPVSDYYFSLNAPSWSLSDEMAFYVAFFFLVTLAPRRLLRLTLGLGGVVLISALLVQVFLGETRFFGKYPLSHWLFYVFPGFRILEFMIGMLLHDLWQRGKRLPAGLIPLSYLLLFAAMWIAPAVADPFRYSLFYLPVIMLFFYAHLSERSAWTGFYASSLLVLLGNASFAFYLIHQPMLHLMNLFLRGAMPADAVFFPVSLGITVVASVLLYKLYEMPAERALKGLIRRRFATPRPQAERV